MSGETSCQHSYKYGAAGSHGVSQGAQHVLNCLSKPSDTRQGVAKLGYGQSPQSYGPKVVSHSSTKKFRFVSSQVSSFLQYAMDIAHTRSINDT